LVGPGFSFLETKNIRRYFIKKVEETFVSYRPDAVNIPANQLFIGHFVSPI
jgi:hypothetical protein